MMDLLAALMGGNKKQQDATDAQKDADDKKKKEQSSPDMMGMVGGMLGGLLQNPLLLAVIAAVVMISGKGSEIMNAVMKMVGMGGEEPAKTDAPANPETAKTQASVPEKRQAITAQITSDTKQPNSAVLNYKGELVAGNLPNEPVDPLSTVKTMTYYTVLDKIKKGELPKDFVQKNDGLFKDMLSASDNGAAAEIAKLAGGKGGEAAFVADMNKLAKAKGMNGTTFTNACGNPEEGMFSTAADMAKWQFLLVKEFPKESLQYSATEKVSTAVNAGITKGDSQTYKTGTGSGFYGRVTSAKDGQEKARSGVGTVDVNGDGIADGSFAIAEVKTGEGADYGGISKTIAAKSKSLAHSDVSGAEMNRFPPPETPAKQAAPKQAVAK